MMMQMVGKGGGKGLKGLINCYLKKSGKLTSKRLCKMNSVITKVHVLPSNGNKMNCLFHNTNLQPTLLTKTKISQDSYFFYLLAKNQVPQELSIGRDCHQAWLFICLCSVIFLFVS